MKLSVVFVLSALALFVSAVPITPSPNDLGVIEMPATTPVQKPSDKPKVVAKPTATGTQKSPTAKPTGSSHTNAPTPAPTPTPTPTEKPKPAASAAPKGKLGRRAEPTATVNKVAKVDPTKAAKSTAPSDTASPTSSDTKSEANVVNGKKSSMEGHSIEGMTSVGGGLPSKEKSGKSSDVKNVSPTAVPKADEVPRVVPKLTGAHLKPGTAEPVAAIPTKETKNTA